MEKRFIEVTGKGIHRNTKAMLEVISETPCRIVTKEVFSIGLVGTTTKQQREKVIHWNKENSRMAGCPNLNDYFSITDFTPEVSSEHYETHFFSK